MGWIKQAGWLIFSLIAKLIFIAGTALSAGAAFALAGSLFQWQHNILLLAAGTVMVALSVQSHKRFSI